ncbi:hypothetical protein FOMG_18068 [Fusarium oxysporum f. sp. melonis 26406]|uniref:Uncharacterized protein n=1 Tax=Fusarium oxysporum f. sp. melonis 26406 TaxID=1089452 RepID=W9Z9H9_FUSOX|nr:hypothetical protein FOMG_18068 [Fusarium oxysporum f. sp. melonis 26406]
MSSIDHRPDKGQHSKDGDAIIIMVVQMIQIVTVTTIIIMFTVDQWMTTP